MARALFAAVQQGGFLTASTSCTPIGGSSNVVWSTTESESQTVVRVTGTLTQFAVRHTASDGSACVAALRKNGSDANQAISLGTGIGTYSDTQNLDTLAAGDKFDVRFTYTTAPSVGFVRALFQTNGVPHGAYFVGGSPGSGNSITASATAYASPCGTGASKTLEANCKLRLRTAGKITNAQINVKSNASTSTSTVTSRVNGANGIISISVGAGLTGIFEDTAHADTVNAGDDFCAQISNGGGGALVYTIIGFAITGSGCQNDVFARAASVTRAAGAGNNYYSVIGEWVNGTTENLRQVEHGFQVKTSRLRVFISANTYSTAGTADIRSNSVSGSQVLILSAGVTGLFEDTTNTDTFGPTDAVNMRITGGTSGSITVEWVGLTEEDLTPPPFSRTSQLEYIRM